jgi:hypothetical protein
MFRFTAQGRIGSIREYKNNVLRISVASERIAQGRTDSYTATEWAACVSFDPKLNKRLLADLVVGQNVTFEGLIVPRPRDKNAEKKIFELTLEISSFQPGARPKPKAEPQTADASA